MSCLRWAFCGIHHSHSAVMADPGQSISIGRETDTVDPSSTASSTELSHYLAKWHLGSPWSWSWLLIHFLDVCRKHPWNKKMAVRLIQTHTHCSANWLTCDYTARYPVVILHHTCRSVAPHVPVSRTEQTNQHCVLNLIHMHWSRPLSSTKTVLSLVSLTVLTYYMFLNVHLKFFSWDIWDHDNNHDDSTCRSV